MEKIGNLEEIRCHPDSDGKLSAYAGVKNSKMSKIIIIIIIIISTKNIPELNELIYAGAKLACEKKGVPLKKHEQKLKTYMGNSTGIFR